MFKAIVVRLIFMNIILIILLQPTLSFLDYSKELYIESVAHNTVQRAAVKGQLTSELNTQLKQKLEDAFINTENTQINFTSSIQERGNLIHLEIIAPRNKMFLFSYGTKGINNYYASVETMSEYIP